MRRAEVSSDGQQTLRYRALRDRIAHAGRIPDCREDPAAGEPVVAQQVETAADDLASRTSVREAPAGSTLDIGARIIPFVGGSEKAPTRTGPLTSPP
jgi:hypothetical protein